MKVIKIIRVILFFLLLNFTISAYAYSFCADGIYYNTIESGVVEVTYKTAEYGEITQSYHNDAKGDIIIPSEVSYNNVNYKVTRIGQGAFENCSSLTSISLPNSITSIGLYAFYGCSSLTSISLPNSITTIYHDAFYNCSSLTSISLPDGITTIGDNAFYGCSSLTSISLPDGITTIGDNAFYGCSSVKSIKIPDEVTSIGRNAFSRCDSLITVEISSNKIRTIPDRAFNNCISLSKVTIPDGVNTIGDYTFSGCSNMASIVIPKSVSKLGKYAFSDCKNLFSVDILGSIDAIQEGTFKKCINLKDVSIPSSVTSIGDEAFHGCCFSSINIPNSVKNIGKLAFYECDSLNAITIPGSVETIGESAFLQCDSLTNLIISEGVKIIGTGAFRSCGIKTLSIPSSVDTIGWHAFQYCDELTSLTFEEGLKYIGSEAFYMCGNIESLSIPMSTRYIGNKAFAYCYKIKTLYFYTPVVDISIITRDIKPKIIILGESITRIGENAFRECPIKTIKIPNSVISIGSGAFGGCTSLTHISIPENVTTIGTGAFRNCNNLTSITIPESVTNIEDDAFANCNNVDTICWFSNVSPQKITRYSKSLSHIKVGGNVSNIIAEDFISCSNLSSIIVEQDNSCFDSRDNCNAIIRSSTNELIVGCKNTIIPESVKSIGEKSFYARNDLLSIMIPNGVLLVDNQAFYGCKDLTSITIPESITEIKNDAFSGCIISSLFWNSKLSPKKVISSNSNSISYVAIGESITNIDDGCFENCINLKFISIPNSVKTIGRNAFSGCTLLEEISIPDNVTSIGARAFENCSSIKSIFIPNGIKYINNNTFSGCKLNTIVIGNGVEKIYEQACRPKKTIWLTNTPPDGYYYLSGNINYVANDSFSFSNKKIYQFLSSMFEVDGVKYIPVSPSERTCDAIDCKYDFSIDTITINGQVSYKNISMDVININPYAFYGNTYLNSINVLCNGNIGDYAFNDCKKLNNVNLNNIKSIGNYAFSGCLSLQEIIIPDSVGLLGNSAFEGCSSLKKVQIGKKTEAIQKNTFQDCSSLSFIDLNEGIKTIEEQAFSGCSSISSITIPQSVNRIFNNVFEGCRKLNTVIICDNNEIQNDNNVLTLGSNGASPLFVDCPLDSVYIGRKIIYQTSSNYGYSPFYKNTSLRSIVISDRETIIPANEFYGCTNLKNVSIGNNVESIGDWAFSGCSSLDYFAFGKKVCSIGREAFSDCISMRKIISHATTPPSLGLQALDDINKWECTLYIPKGALSAYQAADQWKDFFFVEDNITITYKLIYYIDNAEYASYDVVYGDTPIYVEAPSKEGFTFLWSEIPSTMPANDVIINGTYTINSYNLVYRIDGVDYIIRTMTYGSNITAEPVPTKEGYTFSGWSEIPATMPAKDVEITGTFNVNSYQLTYILDGEVYKTLSIDYGTEIEVEPYPVKEGFTFSEWNGIPQAMPAHDVTVSGSFSINSYKLTYIVDGVEYMTYLIEYGASINAEPVPSKEGYTFSGWSDIPETMPAHDVVITSSFAINQYKITYVIDNEEYVVDIVDYGSTIVPPEVAEKEGFDFNWEEYPETMPAKDIVIRGSYTTGVMSIGVDPAAYKVFSVEGREMESLQPGINLIRYNNGTVKKVVVN